jgi:broad-specificity NMP kinase
MRIIILEGARGTGKSTVARAVRQKIPEITLVNPTGFHLDGEEGLKKVVNYYYAWINMLSNLHNHNSTFVFDRFFFTERVFSELYKSYNFNDYYEVFLEDLCNVAEVDIIFLTINDTEELKTRLMRDKVPFGKAEENVTETLKQQDLYEDIMVDFFRDYSNKNARLHTIDTSNKTQEEIQEEVFKIVRKES